MDVGALDPEELLAVSPLVAVTVSRLLAAEPRLTSLPSVSLAILAVTSRYEAQLRSAIDEGFTLLSEPEVRRELMYLENTARPLSVSPSITAAELVASARRDIGGVADTRAVRVFEHAVATLVRRVRTRKNSTLAMRT